MKKTIQLEEKVFHCSLICLLTFILMLTVSTQAQIPQTLSLQALLTNTDGSYLPNGNVNLQFNLYETEAGGSSLWTETREVGVINSIFSVILGEVNPLNLPFDKPYFVGIKVNGNAELTPRIALTASPYSLGGSQFVQPSPGQDIEVKDANGNVVHSLSADGTSSHNGKAYFAQGIVAGDTTVLAMDSTIISEETNQKSASLIDEEQKDVSGYLAKFGNGVGGWSKKGSGVAGDSEKGDGVFGYSTSGYGVIGIGKEKTGVCGEGVENGVYGNSSHGDGVMGNSTYGIGVFGKSRFCGVKGSCIDYYGVWGESNNGYGVWGESETGIGVYGYSGDGFAGAFEGNVTVTKTLQIGEVNNNEDLNRFLVWGSDSIVYWRSLSEMSGFDGVLVDRPLKIQDDSDETRVQLNPDGSATFNTNSGTALTGKSKSGQGVFGSSIDSTGVYGYSFYNSGVEGSGFIGVEGSGSSYGMYGHGHKIGVYGQGTNIDLLLNYTGTGVYGTGYDYGVYGTSLYSGLFGAYGGTGVYGAGCDYGIQGVSEDGIAGGFEGRVEITKTLKIGEVNNNEDLNRFLVWGNDNIVYWRSLPRFDGILVDKPLILKKNEEGDPTVQLNPTGNATFKATSGDAISGESVSGTGVFGSSEQSYGIYGISDNGVGIFGHSDNFTGVKGSSLEGDGIYGVSSSSRGVHGYSIENAGVYGQSSSGIGIIGESSYNLAGQFIGPVQITKTLQIDEVNNDETSNRYLTWGSDNKVYWRSAPSGGSTFDGIFYNISALFKDGSGQTTSQINPDGTASFTANSGNTVSGISTSGNGIYGESSSGFGVKGRSTSNNGIDGFSQTGKGVYGYSTASENSGAGIWGVAPEGIGVYGESENYYGIYGHSDNDIGIYGHSNSASGVYGKSEEFIGVYGKSEAEVGVYGISDHNSGVEGKSTDGNGVSGTTNAGRGVYGYSFSNTGSYGKSLTGIGVIGESTTNLAGQFLGPVQITKTLQIDEVNNNENVEKFLVWGTDNKVYWRSAPSGGDNNEGVFNTIKVNNATGKTNYQINSDGTSTQLGLATNYVGMNFLLSTLHTVGIGESGVRITDWADNPTMQIDLNGNAYFGGILEKAGGSFKIDHPLDPANKFLYHSFVESPDMMNVYNGNIILDDNGEATVTMPDWFEALNREFRYQLTCIGGFAPVYIAQEIEGNAFKIAGGKTGLKISWQVTGIRHDAFAEAHRIQVEEEKPNDEKGTYMHPELYGVINAPANK